MCRLSIVAMALALLLAAGCSSQEMTRLQQQCNGGDQSACGQLSALAPHTTPYGGP
jgi:uncharacterized lipoprotein